VILYILLQYCRRSSATVAIEYPIQYQHFSINKHKGASILHVSTRLATAPAFPQSESKKTLVEYTKEYSNLPCIAVGKVTISLEFGAEKDQPIPGLPNISLC
jgi:hypothetical protein